MRPVDISTSFADLDVAKDELDSMVLACSSSEPTIFQLVSTNPKDGNTPRLTRKILSVFTFAGKTITNPQIWLCDIYRNLPYGVMDCLQLEDLLKTEKPDFLLCAIAKSHAHLQKGLTDLLMDMLYAHVQRLEGQKDTIQAKLARYYSPGRTTSDISKLTAGDLEQCLRIYAGGTGDEFEVFSLLSAVAAINDFDLSLGNMPWKATTEEDRVRFLLRRKGGCPFADHTVLERLRKHIHLRDFLIALFDFCDSGV